MTEIESLDAVFSEAILQTMEKYSWRWVNAKLVDIKDEDSSLDYAKKDLVQVAVRREKTIRVNRDVWSQMDHANKVALIFHEAIYALVRPSYEGVQSSPKAREVTGQRVSKARRQCSMGNNETQKLHS